jgi:hypothetical protein
MSHPFELKLEDLQEIEITDSFNSHVLFAVIR